jgi:hypothetical protein
VLTAVLGDQVQVAAVQEEEPLELGALGAVDQLGEPGLRCPPA